MAYHLNLQKLIKDLRGPKGLAALTEEVTKLRTEMERIRDNVQPQAQKRLKEIKVRLNGLKSTWDKNQTQLEKEISKSMAGLKKAAKDAEARLQKSLKANGKTKGKKTSKKVVRKATKTTKKVASRTKKRA